ncbi:cell adhesion molecule DSCAM-like [Dysidea avara]|uniref:cell adhesion molecule DSCAM-like n=1 Tax=Dysidea avara TaxID=196820 RepID=UPI0033191901
MACVPNNNGFTYKWEKKNDDLLARVKEITSPDLVLSNLQPKDSGEYRCIVSNSTGKIVSKYKQVKVTVSPPDVILHPSSVTVSATGKAVFQCVVKGYGNIMVEWRKLDSRLPITATINNIKSLNTVTSTLEIKESIGYYKGSYYCSASNGAGVVNSTVAFLNVSVRCAEIIRPPVFNEVLPGGTATFPCLAWSYSGLVYDWQKNDTLQLPSNTEQSFKRWSSSEDIGYTTYVYQLTVSNVQLSNEGSYCCLAINECGVTRSCAWLEVKTLPHIIKQPLSISIKISNNSKCVLECLATGISPIQYKWEKYQSSTNSWIRPSHRAVDITSPKLIFSVITEEDEGVYHCVTTNHDGSVVSNSATITVYGPPIINFITSKSVAFEGNKATLICNATNDVDATTSMRIDWYNSEGAKVESEDKHILVYNVTDPVTGQIQLVLLFDPVNHTDSGEYTCHAINDNDCYTEAKSNLTVEYAPIITITPWSPYTASVGKQVTIICKAEGLPTPTVQWYKNDKAVKKVANIPFQALDVPTTTPHATVYTCVSTNNAGGVIRTTKANISVAIQAMCPPLQNPVNGHVNLQGGGQFAVYSCNSGYSPNGPFILWCSGGRWNPSPPACV